MTGISLVSSIAGTVKSFKTAKEMKGKMEDAEIKAEEALAEAKAGLDLNFFEEMAIQKTPKGNLLFSGPMTPYEESLFSARINAGPKTIARSSPRQTKPVEKEASDD